MNALDLIEQRINRLQNVLGNVGSNNFSNDNPDETVTDSLISVASSLSTAVSGREQINSMIQRTNQLDTYLDPNFIDNHQLLDIKKSYIMTVGNEIVENVEQCKEIEKLLPALDSNNFQDVPDISGKVTTLRKDVLDQKQCNEFIEESLILAMQRYNEIQKNIVDALVKMNLRVDELESKLNTIKK